MQSDGFAGSAGALACIERAARTIIRARIFLGLARAAHAFADEGVRAPSVKSRGFHWETPFYWSWTPKNVISSTPLVTVPTVSSVDCADFSPGFKSAEQ